MVLPASCPCSVGVIAGFCRRKVKVPEAGGPWLQMTSALVLIQPTVYISCCFEHRTYKPADETRVLIAYSYDVHSQLIYSRALLLPFAGCLIEMIIRILCLEMENFSGNTIYFVLILFLS